jgi:hypothetical protein
MLSKLELWIRESLLPMLRDVDWKRWFGWDVLSVIIPSVFVALAFVMVTLDWIPHNLLIAQWFMAVAAVLLIIKTILVAVEHQGRRSARAAVAIVLVIVWVFVGAFCIHQFQIRKISLAALSSAITFKAFSAVPGDLPERSRVTETYDGKPWNESTFADVRLSVTNHADVPIQNLSLTIDVTYGDEKPGIAAIGQLSEITGVTFPKQQPFPDAAISVVDKSGHHSNIPIGSWLAKLPIAYAKQDVICPALRAHEELRLILGTTYWHENNKPPARLKITGSYETTPGTGSVRGTIDQVIPVN